MESSISLKINRRNLMENLRVAFSNRFTVLGELLQNGRRAGADRVDFHYDAATQTLTVEDNGCGLDDFQSLLTVAESGWSENLRLIDRPYGLGFLSALYACQTLTVQSRGYQAVLDCAKVLADEPMSVVPCAQAPSQGARMILAGFNVPAAGKGHSGILDEMGKTLKKLALGNSVRVIFNGECLPNPCALNSGHAFHQTEIGQICLSGLHSESSSPQHHRFLVFLQGVLMHVSDSYEYSPKNLEHYNVVHLTHPDFVGRMPDRHHLIDHDAQINRIEDFLESYWRQQLLEHFEALDEAARPAFVQKFWTPIESLCLELISRLDFIPHQLLGCVDRYPIDSEHYNYSPVTQDLLRTDVQDAKTPLVYLPESLCCEGENARPWMFLYAHDKALILTRTLPAGHWAEQRVCQIDSDQDVAIELLDVTRSAHFSGGWVDGDVTLCRAYRLTVEGLGVVEIDANGMYCHDEGFIIPAGERSGECVHQASSYTCEGDYRENDYEQDCQDLGILIANLRADNPQDVLKNLLAPLWDLRNNPLLQGHTFSLRFDEAGRVAVGLITESV